MNKILVSISLILLVITIYSYTKTDKSPIEKNKKQDNQQNVVLNYKGNTINLDLETYLIGVISGEMPASFEEEALKAQAIAARTYVLARQEFSDTIETTTAAQVYITEEEMKKKWQDKYDFYHNKIVKAVNETKGIILTYKNKPIKAYYYSMSNGYTESSLNVFNEQNDYLEIVESKWDQNNENIIYISKEEFCKNLSITCEEVIINNVIKDESNRVSKIIINDKEFSGVKIRRLLNLRSTDFEFLLENNNIKITTRGYGHGVGMSQYGANYMAKEGYTYKEILLHYYQNVEITKI